MSTSYTNLPKPGRQYTIKELEDYTFEDLAEDGRKFWDTPVNTFKDEITYTNESKPSSTYTNESKP